MENKCLLCDKVKSIRKLKPIDDIDSKFCEKINEIFSIQLTESEMPVKFMVCQQCTVDLDTSYNFFKVVKNAKERLNRVSTNHVLIKVEVKQEALESPDLDDFSVFTNFDCGNDDSDESVKEEDEDDDEVTGEVMRKRTVS
jgi:hypothetical protein